MTIHRPNPAQWLWYAVGGRLPARCRDWVLHDISGPTWAARHFARAVVQITPVLLVLLVPGPLWIRAVAILGGVLMGLFYSLAYMEESCENRAVKHGFPRGLRTEIRRERQKRETAERRQRRAQRHGKPAARQAGQMP